MGEHERKAKGDPLKRTEPHGLFRHPDLEEAQMIDRRFDLNNCGGPPTIASELDEGREE